MWRKGRATCVFESLFDHCPEGVGVLIGFPLQSHDRKLTIFDPHLRGREKRIIGAEEQFRLKILHPCAKTLRVNRIDWHEVGRESFGVFRSHLARILKIQGYRTLALPSRGLPVRPGEIKAVLSYAHVAEAAGMGTIGTHTLLITPEFGTRTRLTALLTEAPLQTTRRIDPVDDCTHCLDCVKICPVQAISSSSPGQRYQVDALRCKLYRDNVDNCGLCQKACSYATGHSENTGGPLVANPSFRVSLNFDQPMNQGD